MTNQWQEEPRDEPNFGPPGPADTGDFRAYSPPPPPERDFVEDSAPQAWNAPGSQWSAPAPTNQRVGSSALVLGVLALLFSFFCALVGVPLAVAAIVIGVKGRQQARLNGQSAGLATAGLVLGIVGIALSALWVVAFLAFGGTPSASS